MDGTEREFSVRCASLAEKSDQEENLRKSSLKRYPYGSHLVTHKYRRRNIDTDDERA